MNALSNPQVGKYLNENCVASYQKVASFRIVNGQKQGGNVASYFCTPDGRVLHAVLGPADAKTLLREARWVVETHKLAQLQGKDDSADYKAVFRKAHAERFRQEKGGTNLAVPAGANSEEILVAVLNQPGLNQNLQGRIHLLLTLAPLVKIEQVYDSIFEKILGERVSTNPVVETGEN